MRIIYFLCVGVMGCIAQWWLVAIVAAVYAFRFRAFELLALGVLYDVSFGMHTWFLPFPCAYTLGALLIVASAQTIKPFLRGASAQ